VRAYRQAARVVEGLTRPVAEMVRAGEDPASLPGIGPKLRAHIVELVESGRLEVLDQLGASLPRGVVELTRVPGLGPKRAMQIAEALGIASVDELEAAIADGRLATVKGFGAKSAAKLREAIVASRAARGKFLLVRVERMLGGILGWTEQAPGVEEVVVAGSLRRRCDTVSDVDLLARVEGDGTPAIEHFVRFAGAVRVEAAGGTKGTLVLRSGLQVDLRVVPAASWGAALHYFTGSKEHNVRIRALAKKKGLRVSEWGVYKGAAEERAGEEQSRGPVGRVAGATEEDVFAALGLAWIPPEIREDRGEVEAAARGTLPTLLQRSDLKGDLQMHSTWSDGRVSIERMALACRERGHEYLAMTDHSGGALAMVNGLTAERARMQWAEIEHVRRAVPDVVVLRSMEVDILKDGSLDMDDETLAQLDVVVVSVHSFMRKMEAGEMTDRIIRALRHPSVDILGHPTGRILGRRPPFAVDMDAVLDAAAELDVAVEINASPYRLDLSAEHAYRAREKGVKIVVSTDAHNERELDYMRFGVDQARRAWCEPKDVLNTLPWPDFRAWLTRRGTRRPPVGPGASAGA
jgi:DNA polymerase (family 10)